MSVTYIGVRHHSPACARLVARTIARLRPAYVLVEGPADMNERMGELYLRHRLPIAVFSSGPGFASYAPFCAYSPEWAALTAARTAKSVPLFIDLPAWHPAFRDRKNRYADAARTQFLNWSLLNNTAWDFAADTRGYTDGLVLGWINPRWSLRYGVYLMPTEANGTKLESSPQRARGEQLELTLQPHADGAALRLLAFRNIANMGVYRDAIAYALAHGTVPDIHADDRPGRRKYGFAINGELPLADDGETGLFARAGWNDGRNESFAFTEVDRTLSAGMQLSGAHWGRPKDHLGVAFAIDALSPAHRDYLALGGQGFTLGDGALAYGRERIVEAYYNIAVIDHLTLAPDIQLIHNPGYNRARGPARFVGMRAHVEF